ncbi:MAG TPA: hypothetical protein VK689_19360 [Armatimonadota bacterium]|nr:hypothetical protein [Armatimonadota bacterium]
MGLVLAAAMGSQPVASDKAAPAAARPEPGMRALEHGWQVLSVAYSRSGRWLASGNADRTARVWDARTGKLEWELPKEC